jgi:DEAD/DEAH box helicase domain-containing protein
MESRQYHVDKLDLAGKKAYVRKVDVDYYTDAMTYTNVRVIDSFDNHRDAGVIVEHGEVQVVRKVVGYKKIKFYTSENLGYGDVNLPEKDMHTTSYWFTVPRDRLRKLNFSPAEIIDGLTGLAYTLHHLAAMFLMADSHDIDRSLGDKSGEWFVSQGKTGRVITSFVNGGREAAETKEGARIDEFDPTIFIFDAYPGGIGFSELLYVEHLNLLSAAHSLIKKCPCAYGCPSCVGPTLEVGKSAKEIVPEIIKLIMTKHEIN